MTQRSTDTLRGMRRSRSLAWLALPFLAALTLAAGCGGGGGETAGTTTTTGSGGGGGGVALPVWLSDAKILVNGGTQENDDCRKGSQIGALHDVFRFRAILKNTPGRTKQTLVVPGGDKAYRRGIASLD